MADLTPLGAFVEQLLVGQGREKRELAEALGVSRQTLWRWLTGDVTTRQIREFARVLGVSERELLLAATAGERAGDEAQPGQWEPEPDVPGEGTSEDGVQLEDYVRSFDRIVRTLRTMPGDRLSIALKVALLDGIKENAAMVGASLPREWYDLRRQVLNGEL